MVSLSFPPMQVHRVKSSCTIPKFTKSSLRFSQREPVLFNLSSVCSKTPHENKEHICLCLCEHRFFSRVLLTMAGLSFPFPSSPCPKPIKALAMLNITGTQILFLHPYNGHEQYLSITRLGIQHLKSHFAAGKYTSGIQWVERLPNGRGTIQNDSCNSI